MMPKTKHPTHTTAQQAAERIGQPMAAEMGLEWVEATFQKESRGTCLCLYLDKEGGLTLDDCERFHKRIQPLLEAIEYDFLEVSSPGIDRPVKTARDFEKNRGALVEVKLYAPQEGSKLHRGYLWAMDEKSVTIVPEKAGKAEAAEGKHTESERGLGRDPARSERDTPEGKKRGCEADVRSMTFARSAVAIVKPVIELEDEEE